MSLEGCASARRERKGWLVQEGRFTPGPGGRFSVLLCCPSSGEGRLRVREVEEGQDASSIRSKGKTATLTTEHQKSDDHSSSSFAGHHLITPAAYQNSMDTNKPHQHQPNRHRSLELCYGQWASIL